jgi:hypothetical protein
MNSSPSLIPAARRLTETLLKETELARLGALNDLAAAAADKEAALREFTDACAARGEATKATSLERTELRRILSAADENALVLEAVGSTLGDLAAKVRTAAATAADPGTYSPPARKNERHVWAASFDASI